MPDLHWVRTNDAVSASFEAVNQDKKDDLELQTFHRRMLWAPGKPSATPFPLSVAAYLAWIYVVAAISAAVRFEHGLLLMAMPILVALLAIVAYRLIQRYELRPQSPDVRDSFTLRLSPSGLDCLVGTQKAVHVAVSAIAEVVGGPRLAVLTQDAKKIQLPCVLDETTHAAIASELNARLREMRAATGDYRGARIDAEEDVMPSERQASTKR